METGARQIGAGCPTGPAMPPGRWFRLGGTGASTHAPDFQPVLPVYRERHGSRGPLSRSIFASVPDAWQLPLGTRRIRNLDDQRHEKLADRSLPADQAGPDYRFAGRCNGGGGEQGVGGTTARPASAIGGIECASADGADQAFTGIARGGNTARLATTGLRGNSTEPGGAGGYRKVTHQPGSHRVGTNFATNGGRAIMSARTMRMASAEPGRDYGKLAGGWS